jgi:L-gulonate 5-dehydrogenase
MKAAIFEAPQKMQVGHWNTPKPGPNEVLVTVKATGICAGDMYIYQGKNPYAAYPIIGGHEICGTIAEVGQNTRGLQPGQLVVVEPFLACGQCYPCRIGKSNCCANLRILGVHQAGGYADLVVAPAMNIHLVPAGLSPVLASFTEPIAIGVQACRRGQLKSGEYVLILGAGPIGLALIEVARAQEARPVVVDVNEARLEFAKKLGAEVLKADENLVQHVLDQTRGEGAPIVMEATGNPKAMEQTAELVASGGRIVIVGLVKKGTMVQFPGLDFTRKEMTMVGSRASVNCFPEALALLAGGKIHYPKMATEFNMWEAPEVFARLNADPASVHKAVLVTNG